MSNNLEQDISSESLQSPRVGAFWQPRSGNADYFNHDDDTPFEESERWHIESSQRGNISSHGRSNGIISHIVETSNNSPQVDFDSYTSAHRQQESISFDQEKEAIIRQLSPEERLANSVAIGMPYEQSDRTFNRPKSRNGNFQKNSFSSGNVEFRRLEGSTVEDVELMRQIRTQEEVPNSVAIGLPLEYPDRDPRSSGMKDNSHRSNFDYYPSQYQHSDRVLQSEEERTMKQLIEQEELLRNKMITTIPSGMKNKCQQSDFTSSYSSENEADMRRLSEQDQRPRNKMENQPPPGRKNYNQQIGLRSSFSDEKEEIMNQLSEQEQLLRIKMENQPTPGRKNHNQQIGLRSSFSNEKEAIMNQLSGEEQRLRDKLTNEIPSRMNDNSPRRVLGLSYISEKEAIINQLSMREQRGGNKSTNHPQAGRNDGSRRSGVTSSFTSEKEAIINQLTTMEKVTARENDDYRQSRFDSCSSSDYQQSQQSHKNSFSLEKVEIIRQLSKPRHTIDRNDTQLTSSINDVSEQISYNSNSTQYRKSNLSSFYREKEAIIRQLSPQEEHLVASVVRRDDNSIFFSNLPIEGEEQVSVLQSNNNTFQDESIEPSGLTSQVNVTRALRRGASFLFRTRSEEPTMENITASHPPLPVVTNNNRLLQNADCTVASSSCVSSLADTMDHTIQRGKNGEKRWKKLSTVIWSINLMLILIAIMIVSIITFGNNADIHQSEYPPPQLDVFPTSSPSISFPPSQSAHPTYGGSWEEILVHHNDTDGESMFLGTGRGDRFGYSISFSDDGSHLAAASVSSSLYETTDSQEGLFGTPDETDKTAYVRVFRQELKNYNEKEQGGSTSWKIAGRTLYFNTTSGLHVTLSKSGRYLVVGIPQLVNENRKKKDVTTATAVGSVQVFKWNNSKDDWISVGDPITTASSSPFFGHNTAISGKKMLVAVGDPHYGKNNVGAVFLFRYMKTNINHKKQWVLENVLKGEKENDLFGQAIQLSNNTLAVSATQNVGSFHHRGKVQIFKIDNNGKLSKNNPSTVEGVPLRSQQYGFSLSLSSSSSSNNLCMAIGDYQYNHVLQGDKQRPSFDAGLVQVYQIEQNSNLVQQSQKQLGTNLFGEEGFDNFGYSIALSPSCSFLAISLPRLQYKASGEVQLYQYTQRKWIPFSSLHGGAQFGWSVAMSKPIGQESMVAISDPSDTNQNGYQAGRIHIYRLNS